MDVPGYRCDRIVGGTSRLRVFKVIGDPTAGPIVEVLLKYVSVMNPQQPYVPFTIRCNSAAGTVDLWLDGVLKLSVPR